MSRLIKNEHALEWVLIKQYCEERLEDLRLENDTPLSEVETATVRGKIEIIKDIIILDQDEEALSEPRNLEYIG
jgi:hypothetical protein